ncbi:hypothetical protein ICE98_00054 [Lactococcus lactis]|nr:hypothetical protein [Lactococcus lactis]
MKIFSLKYKAKKYKLIIYIALGFLLFIIIAVSSLTGGLSENDCDNNTVSITANSASQKENAKVIYDFLVKNYGATPQGASGVLGNLQQESQLDPKSIERPEDTLSGHGLAQWTAGRTTNLMTLQKVRIKMGQFRFTA